MMLLFTGKAIANAEQRWSDQNRQPTYVLMQRAAEALVNHLSSIAGTSRSVLVLAGRGNNGGDGLLVAARLKQAGWSVRLWCVGAPRAGSDAENAWAEAQAAGLQPEPELPEPVPDEWYLDALLGTGFQGEPRGPAAEAIAWLQQRSPDRILAVDCASGLDATTGAAASAVKAGHTLTFIGCKAGLVTGRGPALSGDVILENLAVPLDPAEAIGSAAEIRQLQWPDRHAAVHKGDMGHVLVIGGSHGMAGAGMLASEAALICGAGLVTACIDETGATPLLCRTPEVMLADDELPDALSHRHCLVVGPGLGRDRSAGQRWQQVCDRFFNGAQPWLVDADALWHLALRPVRRDHWILTPHPGEAARLLGCSIEEVEVDRLASARALQHRFGGVVVLKGAGTVVASADQTVVIPYSLGAMATAGMGDVLSGVIGALMAQGVPLAEAAVSGTFAVVASADRLAQTRPVTRASAVLSQLPDTLQQLGFMAERRGLPGGHMATPELEE